MKVTIEKLGRIQHAEFDLKPLTIFVGPNNVGKTWLAYTLAGIFEGFGIEAYIQAYIENEPPIAYEPLEKAINQLTKRGDTKIDLYAFAEKYGESYLNSYASFARQWMRQYMSTQYHLFDAMEVAIDLAETKERFLANIKKLSLPRRKGSGLLNRSKKSGDHILFFFASNDTNELLGERLPEDEIKRFVIENISRSLIQAIYPKVNVFPTERTAIITFNFSSPKIRGRNSLSIPDENLQEISNIFEKTVQELKPFFPLVETPTINTNPKAAIGPVANFGSMLGRLLEIGSTEIEKRQEAWHKNAHLQKYADLADVLEREILQGNIQFSTEEPDPRRDILFNSSNTNVEIPIASSMVKELSSLVLYLRYLAKPGDLLIIDEPEMNLHPTAQVYLTEFLTMLVNEGLHLLITTHSTYVVDHLSNLIEAYKHENKQELIEKFLLQKEDSFIDQQKVSVYEVQKEGKTINILNEDGDINWDTFGDVTDYVQQLHFEM